MTLEPRVQVRKLAADHYGWEDICVKLGIRCDRGRQIVRRMVLRQQLSDPTVFHVKHLQPESVA